MIPTSASEDEVGLLLPPDDHRVTRTDPRGASGARRVLVTDDDLARLFRCYAIFRLVAKVRALLDASLDLGDADSCGAGAVGCEDLESLR